MKIAILNDTHCGVRNSADVFIQTQEKFYKEVFFPYLLENDIKHIIHLGDYYDNRRFINFRALNCNRNHFLKPLREYGITMDIIRGNHDTYYKNTGELNSLKELLGHYMNEVNIIHDATVMDYDGLRVGLVPWIDPENEEQSMKFLAKAKCDIIGGHFEIQGYDMFRGATCPHGLDRNIFKRFEMVMSGHFHTKSQQDNIHYLGSQMEFFSSDDGSKLRGARRDHLFMNEANKQSLEAFNELEVRTKGNVFLDWNPTNEFWFYTEVQPNRKDVDYIIVTYVDNEGLPEEIVKSIEARRHNKSWWKVYGEGQLGEVEGRIYVGWNQLDELPSEARLVSIGMDFGYTNDPSAIVAMYYHNGAYVLDEIAYRKGLSNKALSDYINSYLVSEGKSVVTVLIQQSQRVLMRYDYTEHLLSQA